MRKHYEGKEERGKEGKGEKRKACNVLCLCFLSYRSVIYLLFSFFFLFFVPCTFYCLCSQFLFLSLLIQLVGVHVIPQVFNCLVHSLTRHSFPCSVLELIHSLLYSTNPFSFQFTDTYILFFLLFLLFFFLLLFSLFFLLLLLLFFLLSRVPELDCIELTQVRCRHPPTVSRPIGAEQN